MTFKLEMEVFCLHAIELLIVQIVIATTVQSAGMCTTELVVVGLQGNIIENGGVCSDTLRPHVYFTVKCLDNIRSRCSPSSNIVEVDVCSSKQPLTKEMHVSMSNDNDKDATLSIDLTLLAKYGEELEVLDKFPIHTNLYSTENAVTHVEAIGWQHQTRVQVTFHRTCIKPVLRGSSLNVHDRPRREGNSSTPSIIDTSSKYDMDALSIKEEYTVSGDVDLDGFPVAPENSSHVSKTTLSPTIVHPTVKFIQIPLDTQTSEKLLTNESKHFIPDVTSNERHSPRKLYISSRSLDPADVNQDSITDVKTSILTQNRKDIQYPNLVETADIPSLQTGLTKSSSSISHLQQDHMSTDPRETIKNIKTPIFKDNRKDGEDVNFSIPNIFNRLTESFSSMSDLQEDDISNVPRETIDKINMLMLTGNREDSSDVNSNIGTLERREVKLSPSSNINELAGDINEDQKSTRHHNTDHNVLHQMDKLQAAANTETLVEIKTAEKRSFEKMMEDLVKPRFMKQSRDESLETPSPTLSEFLQRFMQSLKEQNKRNVRKSVHILSTVSVDDNLSQLTDDSKYRKKHPPKDVNISLKGSVHQSVTKQKGPNKRNKNHAFIKHNNGSNKPSIKRKSELRENPTKRHRTVIKKRKMQRLSEYIDSMKRGSSKTTTQGTTKTVNKNKNKNDMKHVYAGSTIDDIMGDISSVRSSRSSRHNVADVVIENNTESPPMIRGDAEFEHTNHAPMPMAAASSSNTSPTFDFKSESDVVEFIRDKTDLMNLEEILLLNKSSDIKESGTDLSAKSNIGLTTKRTVNDVILNVRSSRLSGEDMSDSMLEGYIQSSENVEERNNVTASPIRPVQSVSNTKHINTTFVKRITTGLTMLKNTNNKTTHIGDSTYNTEEITESPLAKNMTKQITNIKNTSISDNAPDSSDVTESASVNKITIKSSLISEVSVTSESTFVKNTSTVLRKVKNTTSKMMSPSTFGHSEATEADDDHVTETTLIEANTSVSSTITLSSTQLSSTNSSPTTNFKKTSITLPPPRVTSTISADSKSMSSSIRENSTSSTISKTDTKSSTTSNSDTKSSTTSNSDTKSSSTRRTTRSTSTSATTATLYPETNSVMKSSTPTKVFTATTHAMTTTTLFESTSTTDVTDNQTTVIPPAQTLGETTTIEPIIVGTTESLLAAKSTQKMSMSAGSDVGSDDTFWPIVAALVIGIPSIIVFAIAITVIHKRRKIDTSRAFYLRGGSHRASIDV